MLSREPAVQTATVEQASWPGCDWKNPAPQARHARSVEAVGATACSWPIAHSVHGAQTPAPDTLVNVPGPHGWHVRSLVAVGG
jgi:hypothetical protein